MSRIKRLDILVDSGFSPQYEKFLKGFFKIDSITSFKDYMKDPSGSPQPDLILFTGGADINPQFYNEPTGEHTRVDKERDKEDYKFFQNFKKVPKIGICRGAQLLCALSGGGIIQHVTGHTSEHLCHYKLKGNNDAPNTITVSSTHHQMMNPFKMNSENYDLIAWAKRFQSDTYLNGDNEETELTSTFLESEIVYFKRSKSLAIQSHPEFEGTKLSTLNVIGYAINNYLFNNKE